MTSILVKMPNWVGDCVMATPAIAHLRRLFPDAQIDGLARPGILGIIEDNPDLNEAIAGDDRKLPREIFEKLRSADYDAILLMPNSFGSAWFAMNLGIPRRIGFSKGGRGMLLTHRIKYDAIEWQTPTPEPIGGKAIKPRATTDDSLPRHMVHYYLRIAETAAAALGRKESELDLNAELPLVLPVSKSSKEACRQLFEQHDIQSKLLVGINPGAAYGGAKRWPPQSLGAVAESLAQSHGAAIISTASKGESALTDEVQQHMKTPILRLGEELDLRGLVALVDRLSLLVTNDSGAMHVAAARKTPTIALFGPTDWNVTYPWSDRAELLRSSPPCAPCFLRECPIDHRCMTHISPEMVVKAATRILSSEKNPVRH